ncbi:ABC transporter ATP-binding protein [Kibdelosporangium aridum]|uniref:ABC-2 type transport system ATP-binding protein n=1 Tax=Kibdelosporangium aridum TaxID=2030 RepID=A0A1W1ZKU3_KIBAR|nr:ABC transporter ATP-binding protein [Kibdelosporangium aridum]SMC49059.1 ABC-2 type transport system ATP-binding protein [Kibdelosporangium aridum]
MSDEQSPAAGDGAGPLVISGLRKAFGTKVAVDSVDLTVGRGSFFGLVGPNGAGKTTTLSMAVGLLRPDAGSVRIFGVDVWREPAKAKALIGVLPDGLSVPERLTGRELIVYSGLIRGMDRKVAESRADELLYVMGLHEAERTLIIDYSAGMRKKIGLANALLHAPKLLILDEPFEAVDPVSAATIRTILNRFVAAGGAVVLSSHVMALVELMCDHVGVMSDGKIVAAGPVDQVKGGEQGLEQAFVALVGGRNEGVEGLEWLAS